ncbi:hypothetical protein B7463_g11455, partial [Scytalidium lignicola]
MVTPTKPIKYTRTKTGCWSCRDAGHKCDEEKPKCGRCKRLSIDCKGWGVRLQWRELDPSKKRNRRRSSAKSTCVKSAQSSIEHLSGSSGGSIALSPTVSRSTMSILPADMPLEEYRLLHHWTTHISPLLCTSSLAQPNPFQTHLTPMAFEKGPLHYMIMSIAAQHLSIEDSSPALGITAQGYQHRAVVSLRAALGDPIARASDMTLASVLVMEIGKRFDGDPKHNVNHLMGAKELIQQRGGPSSFTGSIGEFLISQFAYQDLLASMARNGHASVNWQWFNLGDGLLGRSTGYDTVILQNVAQINVLRSQKQLASSKETTLSSMDIVTAGTAIESELKLWKVPAPNGAQASTAEAHRCSALIYLYRVMYNIGAPHPLTLAYVRRCLDAVASVEPSSPLVAAHVWPLFTAGCESIDPRDRDFVRTRLNEMYRQRRIPSLKRVMEAIEEVWLSKDIEGIDGAEQMCRLGCIEVINDLGREVQLI